MYLAIEIGGTKLQIVVADESLLVKQKRRFAIDKTKGATGILQQLEAGIKSLLGNIKPEAVGVGFGGPVNYKTGKISISHQIGGWSGFELAQWLESLVAAPVFIDNDANVAALGEAVHGAGNNFQTVFYLTLGSGVGGGLVKEGQIYHGALPGEAEIGHIRLDRSGATLESRCSGWAVDQKIRQVISQEPTGILSHLAGAVSAGEAKFLIPALESGDAAAQKILYETADDLAFGLSHAVHLFHPEIIVIGGGLALTGEPLRAAVAAALPNYIMQAFMPGPKIVLAQLGEDTVPIGALALAREGIK